MVKLNYFLLFIGFWGVAVAKDAAFDGGVSKQPHVTISLGEFEELFSSARLESTQRNLLDQRKLEEAEHRHKITELEKLSKRQMEEDALLRREKSRREELSPKNFNFLQNLVAGNFNASSDSAGVERDVASFNVEMIFRVAEPRWTTIPIVNTSSTVVSDWNIAWKGDEEEQQFSCIDPVTSLDAMILIQDNQQVLATNRSGLFRVSFIAYTRVSKTRSLNSLGLSSLIYPISDFSLRIATPGNSSVTNPSIQPNSAVLKLIPSEGFTDISVTLPLSVTSVEIRWLEVSESNDENEAGGVSSSGPSKKDKSTRTKEQAQSTVSHQGLHSIDEGIIRSTHWLEFKTTNEFLTDIEFSIIADGVRVTSIVGLELSSWTQEASSSNTTVKVSLKRNLASTVQLQVSTEMDRDTSSSMEQPVELPRIECMNVLRQTGFIAVIKDANVEVHEENIVGLTRCDASELPSQLRLNTAKPIFLSYRYLHQKNSIFLDVLEHATLDVLEASVDRLHQKIIVTDTVAVHSLVLVVQSTKLQYLELQDLPLSATKFTAAVNSVPTKPVEGKEGSILIPLLVRNEDGGGLLKSVEVSFISKHEPLSSGHQNGTLHLSPTRLAVPISLVTLHLSLPESFDYEFAGNLADDAVDRMEAPVPKAFSYETGKRVVKSDHKFSRLDDLPIWENNESSETQGTVKIMTSKNGRSFYFQRLLVIDDKLSLNATYEKPRVVEKSWWYW